MSMLDLGAADQVDLGYAFRKRHRRRRSSRLTGIAHKAVRRAQAT
jgi:hypothetical protein